MVTRSLFAIIMPVITALCLSACQRPNFELPKLSLTRDVPAPVEIGQGRIQKEPIPADRTVTARAGDTIYILASRYGITPQSLIADNNLQAPFEIGTGQRLSVTPAREHIVKRTDSIFSISQRYAVSQYHLAELNGLEEPYQLVEGQALLIPDTHDFTVLSGSKGVNSALARPAPRANTTVAKVNQAKARVPETTAPRKNFVAPRLSSNDKFTWPVEGEIIKDFGPAAKGVHNDGVNIGADSGANVQVSAPGTVAYIGRNLKSFGSLVLIKHDGGYITAYAHLDEVKVAEGDVLGPGQVLGTVGATGRVDKPQLHFEVRQARQPINPHDVIKS